MPPPKKRYRSNKPPHPRRFDGVSRQQQIQQGPEVKPEIASIIERTRAATSRAELQRLCEEAIELKLNDADALRAFYQKKIDALPPGS